MTINVQQVERATQTPVGYGTSFWDSPVVESAREARLDEVMAEDHPHSLKVGGVLIRNHSRWRDSVEEG